MISLILCGILLFLIDCTCVFLGGLGQCHGHLESYLLIKKSELFHWHYQLTKQ